MLKFMSLSIVFIGNVLVFVLEINLACPTFNFLCNIVVGNMLVFLLKVIIAHARFISPYNVIMCLFLC